MQHRKCKQHFFSRFKDSLSLGIHIRLGNHCVFAFEVCNYLDRAVGFGSNFAYIHIVGVHILLDFFYVCAVKMMLLYKVLYQAMSQISANQTDVFQ